MQHSMKRRLEKHLIAALHRMVEAGQLAEVPARVSLGAPKKEDHGDFAATVALGAAKKEGRNPREVAGFLQAAVGDAGGLLEKTEVAGPGFVNFFVSDAAWRDCLSNIITQGPKYLESDAGGGERILLEYVSANPTGPLHVAHGRGAVIGDVLARLMRTAGYDVHREYYINDLGRQTDVMARSVFLRYGELLGRSFEAPEDFYPGEYVIDIAKDIVAAVGDRYLDAPEAEWIDLMRAEGLEKMMARIREDLAAFNVTFDNYVSERELTDRVDLKAFMAALEASGHVFEEDGKKWFRSTALGDDKDRVVIRDDGRPTYFAADLAYHHDKLERGYTRLIDVWGADHGGYIARVRAGLQALGHAPDVLEVILVQMVSLMRGGEAVRMGKRLGTAVWLRDVVSEAGADATRYFFSMRRSEAQMEFDIDLATKKSVDNPVYYAQMGHARLCAIGRRAAREGYGDLDLGAADLSALTLPDEIALIRFMDRSKDVIAQAAADRASHAVVHYLQDMIAAFHGYYTKYKGTERVISDDRAKTHARLALCDGLRRLLAGLLDVLGVAAPEEMHLEETETPAT